MPNKTVKTRGARAEGDSVELLRYAILGARANIERWEKQIRTIEHQRAYAKSWSQERAKQTQRLKEHGITKRVARKNLKVMPTRRPWTRAARKAAGARMRARWAERRRAVAS